MEDPTLAYEDMLFFERRLTEVISGMQPKVRKWKALLLLTILFTAYTAYYWVSDPSLKVISLWDSLMLHPTFTASLSVLIILFIFFGVHNRVVAPKIINCKTHFLLDSLCVIITGCYWRWSGAHSISISFFSSLSISSSLVTSFLQPGFNLSTNVHALRSAHFNNQ